MDVGRRQGDIWHALRLITLLCRDASAPFTGFLLVRVAPVVNEVIETEVIVFLW